MLNCEWASALTKYDCRQVTDLHGGRAIEIGTPFSLHDGSAVVLYIMDAGSHCVISDNGDTLAHIAGMGVDIARGARLKAIRDRALVHGVSLDAAGDFRCIAQPAQAPYVFARAISGILAVADWAAVQCSAQAPEHDLVAEAEPYIVARNPAWTLERRKAVRGASRAEYRFDFLHGPDLIDVIAPSAQATGGVMRKIGDVQNGAFADGWEPLIVVDDRQDPERASQEIDIIASIGRAMPFTLLQRPNARGVH